MTLCGTSFLDVHKEPEQVSAMMASSILQEPPKISIPAELTEVVMGTTDHPTVHNDSSNVVTNDTTNDDSYTMYDWNKILPKHH